MQTAGRRRFLTPFMSLSIVLGAAAALYSLYHLPTAHLDTRFLLLVAITLGIGSRITVKIPGFPSHISVSDTFIFVTILLYGGEAAVLLAASEAFCSSLRFTRKKLVILFNAGLMAISIFSTVWVLRLCFGSIEDLVSSGYSLSFILAICVMALVHHVVNTGIVVVGCAFKTDQPLWSTWRKYYLWNSITYFAGAMVAGILSKLINVVGFPVFFIATPIIASVYFTYRTYLKNLEAALVQTERAERYLAEMQESEELFHSAFDYAAIGMALVSLEGRWLQVNQSLCEIVGYSEQELLATDFQAITHPDDLSAVTVQINRLLEGEIPSYHAEKRYTHKLGHEVWVLLSISRVRNAQPQSSRLIFQIQDITVRKRAEQQLQHDAFHDALTGLPNRSLFMDHLKLAIARSRRNMSRQFAVLFLDLDRFKLINDSLGHVVGDQLLVGIARRLETCLRPGDTVARLGGDEFTVLLEDTKSVSEAISVAERIKKELVVPFNLRGHEVFTTVSIGIALSTIGYEQPDDILRDADTAMYRAKSLGKSRYEIFDKTMHARAMNLLQLETDLRRAIERREFLIHYQPIISLETGSISGFEALLRWHHPELGLISPAEFIPVAEETGLIIPIGKWALGEACRQMKEWQERFPTYPPTSISVNLSAKQFTLPDLVGQIKRVLQETGLDPRSLKIEITESVVMGNMETAADTLRQMRELGVELSIDDFGTGYSSLSYLHRFPISTLKIDRSFISRMTDQGENVEIVRTINMLARNLGMEVVAEGIETKEQLAQLMALGCKFGQGYLFSKPINVEIVTGLLADAHTYPLIPHSDILIHQENTLVA